MSSFRGRASWRGPGIQTTAVLWIPGSALRAARNDAGLFDIGYEDASASSLEVVPDI